MADWRPHSSIRDVKYFEVISLLSYLLCFFPFSGPARAAWTACMTLSEGSDPSCPSTTARGGPSCPSTAAGGGPSRPSTSPSRPFTTAGGGLSHPSTSPSRPFTTAGGGPSRPSTAAVGFLTIYSCRRWPILTIYLFLLICHLTKIGWNPLWEHLLWLSRQEMGSPASVSLLLSLKGPLKGWPEVTHNMKVMRGHAGETQVQVCVILWTLPAIYKGVGKFFHNVGVLS